jgi:hypothetical protein
MSHYFTLLSLPRSLSDHSLENIWKCYDWTVWVTLFAIILSLASIKVGSEKLKRVVFISTIYESFWLYFRPLLTQADGGKSRNWLFPIYLLTLIKSSLYFKMKLWLD